VTANRASLSNILFFEYIILIKQWRKSNWTATVIKFRTIIVHWYRISENRIMRIFGSKRGVWRKLHN